VSREECPPEMLRAGDAAFVVLYGERIGVRGTVVSVGSASIGIRPLGGSGRVETVAMRDIRRVRRVRPLR
jgi:hypothetical protein